MKRPTAPRGKPAGTAVARRRSGQNAGPFTRAKPLKNISAVLGGLPDERRAEEILADLRAARRRPSSA